MLRSFAYAQDDKIEDYKTLHRCMKYGLMVVAEGYIRKTLHRCMKYGLMVVAEGYIRKLYTDV